MGMERFARAPYTLHESKHFTERRKEINELGAIDFFKEWEKVCRKLQKYPEITSRIEITCKGV